MSSANLDKTLCVYFGGSDSEVSYGDQRLQPITFQDDTSRLVGSLEDAQKGNALMEAAMKRMQLKLNIDKCSLIVFEKKKKIESVRETINRLESLKVGSEVIKAKVKDAYLGDIIHEEGLGKSIEATIMSRYGRIFNSIIEVTAILEDFRIDTMGGMSAGLEIFELAILPSLLNNADVWIELGKTSRDKLENLQNTMFRYLFGVPESTPTPLLRFDLGSLKMEERVIKKKLLFLHHLVSLRGKNNLAGEIFEIQAQYDFPGLVTECRQFLETYDLPNIIDRNNFEVTKNKWKNLVKTNLNLKSQQEVQNEFLKYSKLIGKNLESEKLETKKYVKEMKLRDARTNFRIRSNMLNVKMNRKNDVKYANDLWKCDDCQSMDSQAHIVWCPAYAALREGKDLKCDTDLVKYYQQVMKIREDNQS